MHTSIIRENRDRRRFHHRFYCHPVKMTRGLRQGGLVVEVDGDIHDLQKEEDERREKVLREMGLRIVRFGNDEVMRNRTETVGKIKGAILDLKNLDISR